MYKDVHRPVKSNVGAIREQILGRSLAKESVSRYVASMSGRGRGCQREECERGSDLHAGLIQ